MKITKKNIQFTQTKKRESDKLSRQKRMDFKRLFFSPSKSTPNIASDKPNTTTPNLLSAKKKTACPNLLALHLPIEHLKPKSIRFNRLSSCKNELIKRAFLKAEVCPFENETNSKGKIQKRNSSKNSVIKIRAQYLNFNSSESSRNNSQIIKRKPPRKIRYSKGHQSILTLRSARNQSEMNNDTNLDYTKLTRESDKCSSYSSAIKATNERNIFKTLIPPTTTSLSTLSNEGNRNIFSRGMTLSSLQTSIKCKISLTPLEFIYKGYSESKNSHYALSSTTRSIIKGFAGNAFKGVLSKDNYNRVVMIFRAERPKNLDKEVRWPEISFFGLYDGFRGNKCVDYIAEKLHQNIFKSKAFLQNYAKGINEGFKNIEKKFIFKTINEFKKSRKVNPSAMVDKSGSCVISVMIIDGKCYVINLGDSRVLLSKKNFSSFSQVTTPHCTSNIFEVNRIMKAEGTISTGELNYYGVRGTKNRGRYELVNPGGYRTTRFLGGISSKIQKKKLILSHPDIISFDLNDDPDFLFIGNEVIFEKLSNQDVLECIKLVFRVRCEKHEQYSCRFCIHENCSNVIDLIIKTAQYRGAVGNLSCIIIVFNQNLGMQNELV